MTERAWLRRLPIRARLVAGFVAAMLVVLAAAGGFVYWQVKVALDRELNSELIATSQRLGSNIDARGRLTNQSALLSGERYQVLDAAGRVLSQSPGRPEALLTPDVVRRALTEPVTMDVGELLPANERSLRVYGSPLDAGQSGPAAVLVVSLARDQRDEALRELLAQLVIAGMATLLITTVVGERLAKASLSPVERYRRQAMEVADGATGVRLDVPPDRDDEITRLGHTLNRMLRALEDALERERRFVDDASHELRTPLTVIGTRVQLARRRSRTVEEHERVLEEISLDVDRLSALAEQLLDIRAQQMTSDPDETADLVAAVSAEVERRLTTTARPAETGAEEDQRIQQVLTTAPAQVPLSHSALDRIIANLLDNADKHGRPPVEVSVWVDGDFAVLTVADHGGGMGADTLIVAPERFVRAPEARSRPGSGLGLALVKAIVLATGGELRLCSNGVHECFGTPTPVRCDHDDAMIVTVVLPRSTPQPASG